MGNTYFASVIGFYYIKIQKRPIFRNNAFICRITRGEASAAIGGGGGRAAGCVGERSELTAGGLTVAAEGSRLQI